MDKSVLLVSPKVASGLEYSAARAISLAGQGAIYIRPSENLIPETSSGNEDDDNESSEDDADDDMNTEDEQKHKSSDNKQHHDEDVSCSSRVSTNEERLLQLMDMFPNHSEVYLREALSRYQTVDATALVLSSESNDTDDPPTDLPTFSLKKNDLKEVLASISSKMSTEKEKLKVDEEDLVSDALAYYKDDEFNPKLQLQIQYRGQPSVDTGGVAKNFFTEVLKRVSEQYFEGNEHKLPIYNAEIVASGLMKYIGRIVVHSIIHGGPGLPLFSPIVFNYIVDGNIDQMLNLVTVDDCSLAIQDFVKKVVKSENVSELDQEEVMFFSGDAGVTMMLNNKNKDRFLRSIIMHDAIGKRKVALDQFTSGLELLGFRNEIKKNPEIFQELFVFEKNFLDGKKVCGVLEFTEVPDTVKDYLNNYLNNTSKDNLKRFLLYTTGAPCIPLFGLGKIYVELSDTMAISASTCSNKIAFPTFFGNQNEFNALLEAVICPSGKSFNCI